MATKCIVCGKSLVGGKSNKVFCSDKCRMRKKREDNLPSPEKLAWLEAVERQKTAFEVSREEELENLETDLFILNEAKDDLEYKICDPQERIDSLKQEIVSDKKRLNAIFTLISLPDVEFYNRFLNQDYQMAIEEWKRSKQKFEELKKQGRNWYWMGLPPQSRLKSEIDYGSEEHKRIAEEKGKLSIEHLKLEEEHPFKKTRLSKAIEAKKPTEKEKIQYRKKLVEIIQEIKETENKIQEIEQKQFLIPVYPKPEPVIDRRKPGWHEQKNLPEKIDSGLSLTGADVMKMKFHPFQLPGDLGRFLGKIERSKLAIAVTGESNTGKSYFSFEQAKLFIENRFSVIYFSLEEGISEITKQKIDLYDLGTTAFEIRDKGSLADVRLSASLFDVVIVDSFGKVSDDAKDFDQLRNDFPQTIFIFLFQKTKDGGMRGGSRVLFDSSMVIDMRLENGDRQAVMVKSRYGTKGWIYSAKNRRLVSTGPKS